MIAGLNLCVMGEELLPLGRKSWSAQQTAEFMIANRCDVLNGPALSVERGQLLEDLEFGAKERCS